LREPNGLTRKNRNDDNMAPFHVLRKQHAR